MTPIAERSHFVLPTFTSSILTSLLIIHRQMWKKK